VGIRSGSVTGFPVFRFRGGLFARLKEEQSGDQEEEFQEYGRFFHLGFIMGVNTCMSIRELVRSLVSINVPKNYLRLGY